MNDYQIVSLVPNAELFATWADLVSEAERLDENAAVNLLASVEDGESHRAMNISEFAISVIAGNGGFHEREYSEVMAFADNTERDIAIVKFVLRCLANPLCAGSAEAVEAILQKRAEAN